MLLLALLACPRPQVEDTALDWPEQALDEPPLGLTWDMPEVAEGGFTVLAANVGNLDILRCGDVAYNLCARDAEAAIAARIARLRPDVALLSELLTPAQCAALDEIPSWHACDAPGEQVRRLLGPDYAIACNDRAGYECVAVRREVGQIPGCGERCTVPTVPTGEGCDPGFSVTAVEATVGGRALTLVAAHPQSGNQAEDVACRVHDLGQVLDLEGALIGGDLNLDPWRQDPERADVALWWSRVSRSHGGGLAMHSGLAEHDPPYRTAPLLGQTLDHVASDGLAGRCVTLGAAPDRPPLDLQTGEDALQWLDHLAQWCRLD